MSTKYWVAFSAIEQLDSTFIQRLYNYFGDIETAFKATLDDLKQIEGLSVKKAENFINKKKNIDADKALEDVLRRKYAKKENIGEESKTFEATKARILKRNSVATTTLVERVYQDVEQQIANINKLRSEGRDEEADKLQAQLDQLARDREASIEYQKAHGMTVDAPIECDEKGNALEK